MKVENKQTTPKPSKKSGAGGLTGDDKEGDALRDERHGTYDAAGSNEDVTPEGLKRERKGPYSPTKGRASE